MSSRNSQAQKTFQVGAVPGAKPRNLYLDHFFNFLKGKETKLGFCCFSLSLPIAISGACLKAREKEAGARVRLGLWFGLDSKQMFRQLLVETAQSPL